MKTLEQQTAEYIRNEKFQNRDRELYHPVGLVSHQKRIDTKEAFKEWMISLEPTFFITFLFNRRFDNQNEDQIIKYAKDKLHKFHKYIHKEIFGRYWYRADKINPSEHIKMVLLPQDIKTNLHFHGIAVVKDTDMFPNKKKSFVEHSNRIWNLNKTLSTGDRDVIVPNGSVDIQEPRSIEDVSSYSTRKQDRYEHFKHYYISGSK